MTALHHQYEIAADTIAEDAQAHEAADGHLEPSDSESSALDSTALAPGVVADVNHDTKDHTALMTLPEATSLDGASLRVADTETLGRLGGHAMPEVTVEEAGEVDQTSEATDTGPEGVASEIDQSNALIAKIAADEADRLARKLEDPELTDLAARQALYKAIDQLRTTSTYHAAMLPDTAEAERKSPLLHTPAGSAIDGTPELTTTRPFVSVWEHALRIPESALDREAEFRHTLQVEARTIVDPIRRAAMDKIPDTIKKTITKEWTTRDPEIPGYMYNFAATFDKEDQRPTLTSISCAFSPDVSGGTMVDGINTMHPGYTPLTVSAQFDGSDVTALSFFWRHASVDRNGDKRFGPVWKELASEGRGQLLASLVKLVDKTRVVATQGQLVFMFGKQPHIVGRAMWASNNNSGGNRFQRILAGGSYGGLRAEMQFEYNAKQHAYLAPGAGGKAHMVDAEGVLGMMKDIARFFPIMPEE